MTHVLCVCTLQMSILNEGEVVNELLVVVDGEVQGALSGSAAFMAREQANEQGLSQEDQMAMSFSGGARQKVRQLLTEGRGGQTCWHV